MGYLVCGECGGYYKLKEDEYQDDFSNKCECGGKLGYKDSVDSNNNLKENAIITLCPQCGMENPANSIFCQECGKNIENNSPSLKNINTPSNTSKSSNGNHRKRNYIVGSLVVICLGLFLIVGIGGMIAPDKSVTNVSNVNQSQVNTSNAGPTSTPQQDKAANDYNSGYDAGYKDGYYLNSPGTYSGDYGDGYNVGYKLGKQDKQQGLTPEWEDNQ